MSVTVWIPRIRDVSIIPPGFALSMFVFRANLLKIEEGDPTPEMNIVFDPVDINTGEDVVQISGRL
jgi:hypothetical protein